MMLYPSLAELDLEWLTIEMTADVSVVMLNRCLNKRLDFAEVFFDV
jgi:hypothetical protein